VKELGLELIVRNVMDAIDEEGKVVEGKYSSRNSLQTTTLLDAIDSLSLMLALEVLVGMKSKSKRTHFSVRMILVSGMKRTNVLNCLTFEW
jgi:hypothetical protein